MCRGMKELSVHSKDPADGSIPRITCAEREKELNMELQSYEHAARAVLKKL